MLEWIFKPSKVAPSFLALPLFIVFYLTAVGVYFHPVYILQHIVFHIVLTQQRMAI